MTRLLAVSAVASVALLAAAAAAVIWRGYRMIDRKIGAQ